MLENRLLLAVACSAFLAGTAACQPAEDKAAELSPAASAQPTASTPQAGPSGVSMVELDGVQVEWLEARVGPARTVNGDWRDYTVDGCNVRVRAEDGRIEGYAIPLTQACSAQALPVLAAYDVPQTLNLTFGQFAEARGYSRLQSDCLHMCGNAAEPWIYLASPGPRVSPGIRVGTPRVDDPSIDAGMRIATAIRTAKGDDFLMDARYNCTDEFSEMARRELAAVPVTEIEVGYEDMTCDD